MARSKNLGLSLIEIVVVVAIVLVLVAISYPVFMRAKEKTGEVVTKSNLHQLWIAMDVYRTEHDGQGYYGHHALMGLPNVFDAYVSGWGFNISNEDLLRSGCLRHQDHGGEPNERGWLRYTVYDNEETRYPLFEQFAQNQQENLIVFQDMNCGNEDVSLHDDAVQKTMIGVNLSGSILRKRKSGDPFTLAWWD